MTAGRDRVGRGTRGRTGSNGNDLVPFPLLRCRAPVQIKFLRYPSPAKAGDSKGGLEALAHLHGVQVENPLDSPQALTRAAEEGTSQEPEVHKELPLLLVVRSRIVLKPILGRDGNFGMRALLSLYLPRQR